MVFRALCSLPQRNHQCLAFSSLSRFFPHPFSLITRHSLLGNSPYRHILRTVYLLFLLQLLTRCVCEQTLPRAQSKKHRWMTNHCWLYGVRRMLIATPVPSSVDESTVFLRICIECVWVRVYIKLGISKDGMVMLQLRLELPRQVVSLIAVAWLSSSSSTWARVVFRPTTELYAKVRLRSFHFLRRVSC